eukprot:2503202-Pyramimonas_sp.AAC.1
MAAPSVSSSAKERAGNARGNSFWLWTAAQNGGDVAWSIGKGSVQYFVVGDALGASSRMTALLCRS